MNAAKNGPLPTLHGRALQTRAPVFPFSDFRPRRGLSRICSCCPFLTKTLSLVWNSCSNCFLKRVTGLNKIERTLTGVSALDLLLYNPPILSHTLDNSVVKRVDVLMRDGLDNSNGLYNTLIQSRQSTTSSELQDGETALASCLGVQPQYLPLLKTALTEIRTAYLARQTILVLQQTPFDANNLEHMKVLHTFWDFLMDGLPLPQRYGMEASAAPGNSWSDIGFQSIPAKDFRSAGFLGALNLLWFSEKHRLRARQILSETSSTESHLWFPFAATGLNVTVWLLSLMENGHLDVFFFNNTRSTPVETFNVIYSFVFLEFSRFWRLSRPVNILQFGDVSKQFLAKIEETLQEISSPSYHSEWSVPLTSTGDELIEELRFWIDGDVLTKQSLQSRILQSSPASRFVAKLSTIPA